MNQGWGTPSTLNFPSFEEISFSDFNKKTGRIRKIFNIKTELLENKECYNRSVGFSYANNTVFYMKFEPEMGYKPRFSNVVIKKISIRTKKILFSSKIEFKNHHAFNYNNHVDASKHLRQYIIEKERKYVAKEISDFKLIPAIVDFIKEKDLRIQLENSLKFEFFKRNGEDFVIVFEKKRIVVSSIDMKIQRVVFKFEGKCEAKDVRIRRFRGENNYDIIGFRVEYFDGKNKKLFGFF